MRGKEPADALLHCATHRSGLLTINKGAPKAGSLSFARSWAATVFMAIFVTVSECCTFVRAVVTCCAASTTANRCALLLRTIAGGRWRQLRRVDRLLQAVRAKNNAAHSLASVSMPLDNNEA